MEVRPSPTKRLKAMRQDRVRHVRGLAGGGQVKSSSKAGGRVRSVADVLREMKADKEAYGW